MKRAFDLPEADWRAATSLVAGTVLFSALLQLESYVLYARDGSVAGDASYALALPFLQLDGLLLGTLFGVAWILTRWNASRVAVVAIAFAANAWAIVNQVVYGILRQSVSLFDPEATIRNLTVGATQFAGSVPPAAFALAGVNLAVLTTGAVWLWRRAVLRPSQVAAPTVRLGITPRAGAIAALYVVLAVLTPAVIDTHGLERHAVVALLAPVPATDTRWAGESTVPDSLLRRLKFGQFRPDASDSRLPELAARARSLQRPNVLVIVLESVGSEQLLPGGAVDSTLTPNLARLARSGALFPNIYSASPATTPAHIPMMTGASSITLSDADEYFRHPYTGPTLPAALRSMGYHTGLFAATDLSFAELDRFYRLMPWDTLVQFGEGRGPLDASQRVHSWGVNEGHLWSHALAWVEKTRTPFFLNFQTISTHYPYGTPPEFHGPRPVTDAASRYANALAYTDAVLGRMLSDLKARGESDRTIVVITGDHGEAFGGKHADNVTHRNYIYDENMRSFLLFAVPGFRGPITSRRVGTHADMLPSVLAMLGATTSASGQDLFAAGFTPRPAYFHKGVPPALWGLRDGQWKFIDRMAGGAPQLFDLDHDADERTNLASQHSDMVAAYRAMVTAWYARANRDFVSHLAGLDSADVSAVSASLYRHGLRDVRVGDYSSVDGDFTTQAELPRNGRLALMVRWFALDRATTIRVRIVSPARRVWVYPVVVAESWSSTKVMPPLTTQEPGRWTVDVWSGPRKLGRTVFEVR